MNVKLNDTDHVQGAENAPIVLIEYADYQCPYCGKSYYIIKKAQEKLGDKLKFVFRNFPITELHENAVSAAIAAEAAGKQGKFWEMHDMLFENQQYLNEYNIMEYAQKLNLDISRFESDYDSVDCVTKVQNDLNSGLELGVQGTPTFFINGQRFEGNWMDPDFIDRLKSYAKQ